MPREAHAELGRVHPVVLAPPLGRELHGRGHDGLRARRDQRVMQRVAKAAGFVDGVHGVAGGGLLLHPGQELGPGQLGRGLDRPVLALRGRDHVTQVHIQPQFEHVAGGRSRRGRRGVHCGIALGGRWG